MLAVRRSGLENVGVLALALTPENVVAVPGADCTICLSVWHHFVRHNGLERATEMLETHLGGNAEGAVLRHGRERDDARVPASRR